MVSSMTAFVSQSWEGKDIKLTWEVRSVNHRFLELSFKLPEALRPIEADFRVMMQSKLKRGKVDAILKFQASGEQVADFSIDQAALTKLNEACSSVLPVFPQAQVNMLDVLRWQGVMKKNEQDNSRVQDQAKALLDQALAALVQQRAKEGAKINIFMLEALQQIQHQRDIIDKRMPHYIAKARATLREKVQQLQVDVDEQRFEQEMLYWVARQDLAEELQRLQAHVEETREVLEQGGVVGRRLDFLMQELNREANTVSSKSGDTLVTKAAVEIKVLVEQIREQVQNIE